MRIKNVDENSEMQISLPPEERLNYYLQKVEATDLFNLSFEQRRGIFLHAIKDFLEGVINSDELASLSFYLQDLKSDPKKFSKEENELFIVTLSASELSFYIRKIDSPDSVSQFDIFMFEVLSFYKKHADLL